jgi:hypothetical protein
VKRRQTSSRSKRAKAARQAAEVQTLEVRAREAELSNAARVRAYVDLFSKVGAMVRDPAMDELTRLRLRNLLQEHHQLYGGLMQPTDDRSILKRVAVKTGHRSVESLWHYIDLAWDEMDVWGKVDGALERLRSTDRFYEELLDLRRDVATSRSATPAQIIDHVTARLSEILGDARVGFASVE